MKRAAKIVGVDEGRNGTSWHIVNSTGTDYATLCGVDADDPTVGHFGTVEPKPRQRITCCQCYGMWRGVVSLSIRVDDFAPEATR